MKPPTHTRLLCVVPNPSIDKLAEVARLEPGTIHRPATLVALPGGKGLNVARAGRHLGVEVEAVLLLAGHAGHWMDAQLERIGLQRRVAWVDGETRTCLSVLDQSTGQLSEFYERGPSVSRAEWQRFVEMFEAALAALPNAMPVTISGSFPPGVSPASAARLVAIARNGGYRAIVDTTGAHLRRALEARPYLVKVNLDEAHAVVGGPATSEADAANAARKLVERGAEQAIVTRGPDGAVGFDGERAWAVDPLPGGRYAVGSGDAFMAGVAAGLGVGSSLQDCMRRGAAAGAASTLVRGQGELRRREAERFYRLAHIRPIA